MRTIEEVVKEISDNAQYRNGDPTYLFEGYDVEKALREIIEIHKVERPIGEWIDMPFGHHCSNCHKGTIFINRVYDFCPNCGAKMKGGEEE